MAVARTYWYLRGFLWLEPAVACSAEFSARTILTWCALMGVPRVFISDTATHFEGRYGPYGSEFWVTNHFAVADCAWTNATIERANREVIHTFRSILNEQSRR